MTKKINKCSICVNTNKETVVKISPNYYMCAACVREEHEQSRDKIRRLEDLLQYVIHNGL